MKETGKGQKSIKFPREYNAEDVINVLIYEFGINRECHNVQLLSPVGPIG